MNDKEEHPSLLYLKQIFDYRAKCGLQTKIDPQDESRWTWPLFGQFRGCYWCDPAWIQRHFSYCHMWFSTFAQENHVNDAKNCHAAFASKKILSFNRYANHKNLLHTMWTVNDVLVDPYPFYCIKRVWINQEINDGPRYYFLNLGTVLNWNLPQYFNFLLNKLVETIQG